MAAPSDTAPRIAIVSSSERQRINLGLILDKNGLQVVLNQSPSREFLALACERKAEALLIDLDEEAAFSEALLTPLLEQDRLPMLLNGDTDGYRYPEWRLGAAPRAQTRGVGAGNTQSPAGKRRTRARRRIERQP